MTALSPDVPHPKEEAEKIETFEGAEALKNYRETPVEVPVGGLPAKDYERWREATDKIKLAPQQALERGWMELEYGMAMMRGAIDPETEEPFDERKINMAFEAARQFFSRLAKDESAPLPLRMEARLAALSVSQHQEVIKGKPMTSSARYYAQFLNGLRSTAQTMLHEVENTPELGHLIHVAELMAIMTETAYLGGWYLPAAPRQPWDVTMHIAQRLSPDVNIVIDRPRTTDDELDVYSDQMAGFVDKKGPFAVMRTYLEVEVDFAKGRGKPAFPKGSGLAEKWMVQKEKGNSLGRIIDNLLPRVNAQIERLVAKGIRPAEEIIVETAHVEEPVRDIHPEVTWYLTEYQPEISSPELAVQVAALEKRRSTEGLFPDEQRALGWMQLELAVAMALEAQEQPELDTARERFAAAMDTFIRAQRMFTRMRRPGDAHDALLAQAGTDVYRAFYTSRNKDGSVDNYAVRRAISRYIEQVSDAFASANKVKADPEQVAALTHMAHRATLIMLQAVANEELRHLVLPAPLRTGDRQDVTALHLILSEKVSGYDITQPISVKLVDGSDITAGDHEVFVGRDALNIAGSPDALLRELVALLGKEGGKGKVGKKAKGAKPKQGSVAIARSEEVRNLSEQLAYAISDAYEYEAE